MLMQHSRSTQQAFDASTLAEAASKAMAAESLISFDFMAYPSIIKKCLKSAVGDIARIAIKQF